MTASIRPLLGTRTLGALVLVFLGACKGSPVTSTRMAGHVDTPVVGGVTYYLPKKVLSINVWSRTVKASAALPPPAVIAPGTGPIEPIPVPAPETKRYFGTLAKELVIPDRNYLMRLRTHPISSARDTVEVCMTPEGLLQHVHTAIKDESPAIVAKLTELASPLAQAVDQMKDSGLTASIPVLERTVIVDPADPKSYAMLREYGITFTSEPMLAGADDCCVLKPGAPCAPFEVESGVCYRPVIPFHVEIRPGGKEPELLPNGQLTETMELRLGYQAVVMLPNLSPVVCLPIERAPFVEVTFDAKFKDGFLTAIYSDTPSVILGFLDIPIRVAKAVVGIPAELLTFKIKHYNDLKAERTASGH